MYGVIIVDDNLITKKSLALTINWQELGCNVVADADDGVAALALVKQYKPDIIITDIRMPRMDGLKLTQKVKELFPSTKVIITTGYSEFTYAKEAIRLGAFDLIVKPIDSNELIRVVKRAVEALDDEKREKTEKEHLKSAIQKDNDLLIAKAVTDCIQGLSVDNTYGPIFQRFAIFSVEYKLDFKTIKDETLRNLLDDSNNAAKALKQKYNCEIIYFWINNKYSVLVAEKSGQISKITYEYLNDVCNEFVKSNYAARYYNYTIGVSKIHSRFKEIKTAYCESIDALECGFYFSDKKIIFAESLKGKGIINESTQIKKIYDSIKNGDIEKFNSIMDEIRDTLIAETPDIQSVKIMLSNICFIAIDFYYTSQSYKLYNYKSHSEINNEINALDNLENTIKYVKNLVSILIKSQNSDMRKNYSKLTLQVIDYLNEHYDKKVSLQEISDYVSLTPSYVSRVIKKDTGQSFVDLFNNIKISIAEKLLRESNLKVYEVANKVGIENYSYFYQLFKKATGISPTDYYKSEGGRQR